MGDDDATARQVTGPVAGPGAASAFDRDVPDPFHVHFARAAATGAGAFVVLLGAAVLVGWALKVPLLTAVVPGWVSMKPNTAATFVAAGLALVLRMRREASRRSRAFATGLALCVVLLALVNLLQYATGRIFGIDELLFRDPVPFGTFPPPGRMAPITAWAFALSGTALALLDRRRPRRLPGALADFAALLAAAVLAGYAYGLYSLSSVTGYRSVAIHTALGLLVLALGIACARPEDGFLRIVVSRTAAGNMARRLLPAAVVVPPVLGWLFLVAEESGRLDVHFGVALFAISIVLVFVALVGWNASRLFAMEAEQRAAVESVRSNEERLRLVVAHTPAAVAMLDREMRYILVNPRWISDFGLTGRDITGISHYDVFPEFPERWREIHRRCLAGASEVCDEDSYERQDGSVEWLRREIHPWRNERGAIGGIVIFAELTTARRRTEEALRRTEDQLRQAQKMEAIGRVTGGIAHDFNNLLTVINGYAELLLGSLPAESRHRESLAAIAAAGQRAAGLTRQLLAFSRKQVLDPRVLDLNEILSGMEMLLRRLIGEDIELAVVLDEGLGAVMADRGQMEQVVLNLAVNARDAMPRGGRLLIETANVRLDAEYAAGHAEVRAGPYAMIAVSDTGIGMDPETTSRIFEPFFTTKETGKGTGLGLATVYGIVKQSGGHIGVYSELRQGATFRVYLPRVEAVPRLSGPFPAAAGALEGTETILVVEDDPSLRMFAQEALTARGYSVLAASGGDEGLAVAGARTGVIDLLVTDVVMPGMSGREVAARLEALRPGLEVLYISGYTELATVQNGRLEAGVEFLQKPFGADALVRRVRALLDAPKGRS